MLRDGAAGCVLCAAGQPPERVPVRSVAALDTTGAGDVHTAALLAVLARGVSPPLAAKQANVAASLAVSRRGGASAPTLREFLDAL